MLTFTRKLLRESRTSKQFPPVKPKMPSRAGLKRGHALKSLPVVHRMLEQPLLMRAIQQNTKKLKADPHGAKMPRFLQHFNRSTTFTVPPIVHKGLASSGQTLDPTTRAFMEQRLGYDFNRVRVHNNLQADASARTVHARAFTFGGDIVFKDGQYNPHTEEGRRLLAHELIHVIQQHNGAEAGLQRDDDKGTQTSSPPQTVPLRLVFYQQGTSDDTPSFKAHAEILATNLSATELPYGGCETDNTSIGSIPCDREENVLIRAANYAKCLQQKVEQVHVVGHVSASDNVACLSGGLDAESAKWYLPNAKVVVHGCKGLQRLAWRTTSILHHLPEASVYAHKAQAESGGPLDFYKITINPNSADPQTITTRITTISGEGIGFTTESVNQWAQAQLDALRQAVQSNDRVVIRNIKDWLTLPIFASAETAVFADTVLADTTGLVPVNIVNAAKEFKEKWAAAQQPSVP